MEPQAMKKRQLRLYTTWLNIFYIHFVSLALSFISYTPSVFKECMHIFGHCFSSFYSNVMCRDLFLGLMLQGIQMENLR